MCCTHMHTQSPPLVHRDLKPDNIMLLEDRKSIKMIDFGTARDLGRTQKEKLAAKTKVYTEGYAPPEQIIGRPEPRSDLFALAGTMYHLATGKAPEGYYTAREIETQLSEPHGPVPADQRWFYELIRIELGRGRERALFLGPRNQGRFGQAASDPRGGVSEMSAGQQGARAVLRQDVPSR